MQSVQCTGWLMRCVTISKCKHYNIIEFFNQHPGKVTFICVGPLTNIALAIKMYHDFSDKIKALYLMGGNYNGTKFIL